VAGHEDAPRGTRAVETGVAVVEAGEVALADPSGLSVYVNATRWLDILRRKGLNIKRAADRLTLNFFLQSFIVIEEIVVVVALKAETRSKR
jgi:hypothetical protein